MIKTRLLIISLLLALLGSPLITLAASNISNAQYYGTVQVSNNSTAAANVATTGNMSTVNLINGNYLNSSANNCVVRSSAGADIPFMPSVNASYPWCFWVPSIGANSYLNYILYTANSTGGEIRYFPGAGGMTTPDNDATLELGDNFTIEQKGWIDTSAVSENIVSKDAAYQTYISSNGDITSRIRDSNVFDQYSVNDDAVASIYGVGGAGVWKAQTITHADTYPIASIDVLIYRLGNPGILTCNITTTAASKPSGVSLTSGTTDGDTLTVNAAGEWRTITFASPAILTGGTMYAIVLHADDGGVADAVKWRLDASAPAYAGGAYVASGDGGATWAITAGSDFLFKTYQSAEVTASGKTSGEYRVTTTANVTHMWIAINGVTANTTALSGVSVLDNSENWTFCQAAAMPYLEYQEITIDGVQAQYIEWEYSDNFTDQSANNNYAIPTFRTASSDADVSASMTAFLPISEAKAPDYVLGEAPAFIDADALTGNITSTFTTTPGASTGTFPLAGVITAMANATSTPPQLPLLIIAAFIIIAASLSVSSIIRRHGSGSLIVKSIVIVSLMGIFVALGDFAIDFWMIGVFLVLAVAMAFASRQLGWT